MKRVIFLVAILAAGCQGLTLTDGGEATLRLRITSEDVLTKASLRPLPDTNLMRLIVRSSYDDTLYNGLYGARPEEMKLEAGEYFVEVFSHKHKAPAFDSPCWADARQVTLTSGTTKSLNLQIRQVNAGISLGFSSEFMTKYSAYTPELYTAEGASAYNYGEERFLYVNPGKFYVRLKPSLSTATPVPLFSKSVSAKEMLTINLKLAAGDSSFLGRGITIDTTYAFKLDTLLIDGNDGSSRAKAISLSRLSEFEGMKVWVKGYIVGGDVSADSVKYVSPFTKASHMAIAEEPDERLRAKCFGVSLPSGKIQDQFSLVAFPEHLSRRVWVKGTVVSSYLGGPGINPVTEAILE